MRTPDEQRAAWGLRPLTLRERLASALDEPTNLDRESLEVGEPHPASDREGSED